VGRFRAVWKAGTGTRGEDVKTVPGQQDESPNGQKKANHRRPDAYYGEPGAGRDKGDPSEKLNHVAIKSNRVTTLVVQAGGGGVGGGGTRKKTGP